MSLFNGTTLLITGGTKGIGLAVAHKFARQGYSLILTYASDFIGAKAESGKLAEMYPVKVDIICADIKQAESIDKISSYLEDNNITLCGVILNAGITCRDSFEDILMEDWQYVFFANIHFPLFLLKRIIDRVAPCSSVIFTGSLMGIEAHSVSLAYGVTKSAVHSMVKNLVKFLVPYKIRVNAVAPGFVDTEWQKNKPAQIRQNIENKVALGSFCEPADLANVYFMIHENSYLNGEIIVVDGGYNYK